MKLAFQQDSTAQHSTAQRRTALHCRTGARAGARVRSTHAETALATMRSISVAERTDNLVVGIGRGREGACERRARSHGLPHMTFGKTGRMWDRRQGEAMGMKRINAGYVQFLMLELRLRSCVECKQMDESY